MLLGGREPETFFILPRVGDTVIRRCGCQLPSLQDRAGSEFGYAQSPAATQWYEAKGRAFLGQRRVDPPTGCPVRCRGRVDRVHVHAEASMSRTLTPFRSA